MTAITLDLLIASASGSNFTTLAYSWSRTRPDFLVITDGFYRDNGNSITGITIGGVNVLSGVTRVDRPRVGSSGINMADLSYWIVDCRNLTIPTSGNVVLTFSGGAGGHGICIVGVTGAVAITELNYQDNTTSAITSGLAVPAGEDVLLLVANGGLPGTITPSPTPLFASGYGGAGTYRFTSGMVLRPSDDTTDPVYAHGNGSNIGKIATLKLHTPKTSQVWPRGGNVYAPLG